MGSSTGYRYWMGGNSMDGKGTTWIMITTMGCRGIFAPVPGAPPPSFSLTLISEGLFLTYSHSSLLAGVAHQYFPLLKYVSTEALPPLLMGSTLASCNSVLKSDGEHVPMVKVGTSSSIFSQKAILPPTSHSPPLPYQNLAMQTQYGLSVLFPSVIFLKYVLGKIVCLTPFPWLSEIFTEMFLLTTASVIWMFLKFIWRSDSLLF